MSAAVLPLEIVGLISFLITLLIVAILLRVVFSYFPGMSYTPLGRFLYQATEWLLEPIRRIVPPIASIDFSPLVATFLLIALRSVIVSGDLVGAVLGIVRTILTLLILLVAIRILFAFFRMDPLHPVVRAVVSSSDPFARPFRGWFPRRRGQFDWAPVAALVLLVVLWYAVGLLNTNRFF